MQTTDLTTVFSALADPTRRAILMRLSSGDAPVKDLAEPFDLSGPAITKHLKVLERAGLISRSRDGQQRPCRFDPRGLEPAAEWIEHHRAVWEQKLDRLDAYLKSVAPPPAIAKKPKTKTPKNKAAKPKKARRVRHGISK